VILYDYFWSVDHSTVYGIEGREVKKEKKPVAVDELEEFETLNNEKRKRLKAIMFVCDVHRHTGPVPAA
jgi:hypothetical protein